ncbi:hypothetical protein [Micromonospora narathiwatensis]|uniref:Uncharacterized protein n=1 Tax=Micromonospora narathiwatensis TaxID=299146 RepID=A0A1A8ZSR7_9ACTN|nr:hypothetical protein [Micromonospora narathiwatensis]SBT47161.1 hypothetical protein GA0070621_2824 [Micromonospora narathiwatensis]
MTFWVHYVLPPGAARDGMALPTGDEIIGFAQTVDVGTRDRTVEFSIVAVGDGYQIATDIDCTALLRGHAEEVAAAVDAWVLEFADRAVRVHELLLHRWYDVCSESHRASIEAMQRWLTAQDPVRDYWALLDRTAGAGVWRSSGC